MPQPDMANRTRLDGRVAVVTGGASGISLAMASALGEAGSRVWIADIDEEAGRKAESSLRARRIRANYRRVDVTMSQQVDRLVEEVVSTDGGIDILFNGAGVHMLRTKQAHELPEDRWISVFDVNMKGTFLCSKAASIHMIKAGYGRIINVTSGYSNGAIGASDYAASKAAVITFTRSFAGELRKSSPNVTVNVISPGPTDTPLLRHAMPVEEIRRMEANGSLGAPEDMCSVVLFLASPESSVISGNVLAHKNCLGSMLRHNF